MQINTDPEKIEEILTRGVHAIYTKDELREKLLSGKQLHLKLGTDVTGPLLTLGHSVVHRKMRDFQELGHKVTLVIGDFTTLVGDHSDKVDMRKETSTSEISENERSYKEQFFKTILEESTEIRHNSEWLKGLNFNDVINLSKEFTLQQMLDRETFMLRYKENKPIGLDEFLYPLMQGYDSVALNCDVEFGGTDQTFNLLAGRKLMPVFGLKPQSAIVMRLLTGNDGRPMGKSLKNFTPIMDNPNDMYGKIMSIVDTIIIEYLELATRIPMDKVKEIELEMKNGANPMEFKKLLAKAIVTFYHSKGVANEAETNFKNLVQNKEAPSEMIEYSCKKGQTLSQIVAGANASTSNKEAYRLITQGGVSINEEVIKDPNKIIDIKDESVLKVGKRNYYRIKSR
ncbi:tyrosine--tRNA ligase [candidate division WWE3 bacterium RIFCSPHIGHO2_01_FULL_35_17]|uniref:Tyrosine--tRNA ligase n=1 Tax=candidate division WWE3 bacterium RIFCSPHIGHO2_01_FULL_35_17 TaxID=1802614 RepID=A0A1F4URW3_UNCKA|nr:MAG: tyrosine--tRNA ligase [candidate division WWE3 bacterium RIFCSPHIGHO2_01_FULL_35_17]